MNTTLTSYQLTAFLKLLHDKKMEPERFTSVLMSGILADVLDQKADLRNRDTVRAALKLGLRVKDDVFRLVVDYGMSFDERYAAARLHRSPNDHTGQENLARGYPIEGKGVVEFEACLFRHHGLTSAAMVKRITSEDPTNPWSPSGIEHVLSFSALLPEDQRTEFRDGHIVGLGSVIDIEDGNGGMVSVVPGIGFGKFLSADDWVLDLLPHRGYGWEKGRKVMQWDYDNQFLAVRKAAT